MIGYSYEEGCADVALKMLPGFIGDTFAIPADVYSVWCEDQIICYNDASVAINQLLKGEKFSYRAVLMQ